MILDIEKYPSFVPWCINSEVYERKNFEDRVEIKADMTVGKKILNQIKFKLYQTQLSLIQ